MQMQDVFVGLALFGVGLAETGLRILAEAGIVYMAFAQWRDRRRG